MSRFRAMAARLCAAFIYVQLCLVACRDRLIRLLLLLPVILLPHTAMANTLFDMIKTVGDGAKGSSSSFVTIAQVIGLVLFIAGKRKLTAVCSHQTRIGNLDAHLI